MHRVQPPVPPGCWAGCIPAWDRLNNQIFVYTFTPAHVHTPEVCDQTSPFRDAIQHPTQDWQFQQDHSFRLDCSVCSDRPFCTDHPFWDSGQQLAGKRPPLTSALAHHQDQLLPTMSPTMPPAPKFASGTTSGSALSPTAGMPTRAGHLAATGHTRAKGVSKWAQLSSNTLTTCSIWARARRISWQILGFQAAYCSKIGVRIGHTGPWHYTHACNLSSAFQHPEVIDQELAKECDAGRILGPFTTSPIYPLHCSGLGMIPKKNGKWLCTFLPQWAGVSMMAYTQMSFSFNTAQWMTRSRSSYI